MRSLTLGFLILALTACGSSTSPDATIVSVRLRDDAGEPAGRNHIVVSQTGHADVEAQTGTDGTADLRLDQGGTYLITVVPRNEYVGGTELSKVITVPNNGRASVDFTLHRAGLTTEPPFEPTYR